MSTQERVQALRDAPADSWLALSGDESRVVATGKTYQDAVEKAAQSGERDPILIKTPSEWRPRVL